MSNKSIPVGAPLKASRKFGCAVILILSGVLAYVFYYFTFTHWIPAGYVGVIYNAQGGLEKKFYMPQAVTLNWFQQLYTYPTKLQNAVYSQDPNSGEVKAADGISITTSDNANTVFDISVLYRVKPDDVFKAFSAFGAIPIEDIQSQHIRRAVKEAASAVGSQYDLFSLMGPKRQEASDRLTDSLRDILARKGITVEQAMILTVYPNVDTSAKINSRVNGYIQIDISSLNQKIAEINRQTSVLTAEAKQKAQSMTAAATSQKSLDVIQMDNTEAAIERWDGKVSPLSSDGHQTIVIGSDALGLTDNRGRR